jgi:indolepyruvate ferredoxin oxidoreductase
VHLTGVQALVRLPLDVRRADRREGRSTAVFISGYEGSPLGGYAIELTEAGTFQGEDETRRRSSRRSPPNSNSYGCPYKFF